MSKTTNEGNQEGPKKNSASRNSREQQSGSQKKASRQNGPQYGGQGNYQQNGPYYGGQGNYQQNGPQYNGQGNYQQNGPQYNGQGNYQQNGPYYGGQGNYQQNGPQYNGGPYYGQGNYQGGPYPGGGNYQGYGPQGGYPEEDGRGGKKKKKKKKRNKLLFAIEIIILLVVVIGIFGMALLSRIDRQALNDILVNTGVSASGYRNIAIFGIDSREGQQESGVRTDTIIIASINNKTGDIKLVSVYRDTYLDNTDGVYRKATEAYANGGASLAVNMLNKNLDLDIKDYVTVDFEAVIEVVDELGGVEVTLTDEEVQWLNGYLVETSQVTGRSYTEVESAGTQTLTGIQAMAYCRIRYTVGWDYKRTERQRDVLTQIFKKAQQKGVVGLAAVVNNLLPYISTSLSNTEILALAANISKYEIVDSEGFPFDSTTADLDAGDCVVPVNLAANVTQLHELLFDESSYTPSDTVQEISNTIINNTGIQ